MGGTVGAVGRPLSVRATKRLPKRKRDVGGGGVLLVPFPSNHGPTYQPTEGEVSPPGRGSWWEDVEGYLI